MYSTQKENNKTTTFKSIFIYFSFVIFILGMIFHLMMSREISSNSYILLSDMKKLDKNYAKYITISMKDGKITHYEFNNMYFNIENIKKENIKKRFIENKEEILKYLKS